MPLSDTAEPPLEGHRHSPTDRFGGLKVVGGNMAFRKDESTWKSVIT